MAFLIAMEERAVARAGAAFAGSRRAECAGNADPGGVGRG